MCTTLSASALAETHYVDPSGSDSGPGSESQPWKTITFAMSQVGAGDVVMVADGVYTPSSRIVVPGGVTLKAIGDSAIIDGSGISNKPVLMIWNPDIVVDGLEIRNGPDRGIGVSATRATIRNCRIHGHQDNGIFASDASFCTITGNEIYDNGSNASPNGITHGVYLARNCNDIVFSNNVLRDNYETGIHVNGNDGNVNSNIVLSGNLIYGNGAKAGNFQNTHDSQFVNNVIYNNDTSNLSSGAFTMGSDTNDENGNFVPGTGALRNTIANNTFVSSNHAISVRLSAADPRGGLGAEDNVIFNNICVSSSGSSALSDDGLNNSIDHNYTATYSSSVLNNVFENYQANDYRLKEGSPAEGAGVTSYAGRTAPAQDITGANRVVPYDQGAYEAGGPPPEFGVNVNTQGNGSVTKNPDQPTYTAGENLTLTATPSVGSTFAHWSGDLSGSENPTTFSVLGDMNVTAVFTVAQNNEAPQAAFSATPTSGTAPLSVSFDATASSDPEGDPLTFSWNFGDGAVASGATTSHTYSLADDYVAVLTVSDDHGNSDTFDRTISVAEATTPPTAPRMQLLKEDSPGCVTVTWLASGEPDLAGYVLYYGAESVQKGDVPAYEQSIDLSLATSWRQCTFEQGRYYFSLRAYNQAGQFSGYSLEEDLLVVGPDRVGPVVIPVSPTDGETDVALDAEVRFVVVDDRSNVDPASLTVLIDGSAPADVSLNGMSPGYTVTCTPASDYSPRSTVDVFVSVSDRAEAPNTTNASWSFTATSAPPAPPTGFQAVGSDSGYAHLSWNANTEDDLIGYTVYYGMTSGAYSDSLAISTVTNRSIGGLDAGTYYFALRARNDAGQLSGLSGEAQANVTITSKGGLLPPRDLRLVVQAPGCLSVSWAPNSEPEVSGYVVHYGTESVAEGQSGVYFNSIDVRRKTDAELCDLSTGTYYVAVRAYDDKGRYSGYSTEKNASVAAADAVKPVAVLAYPTPGATGAPVNSKVFIILSDNNSGVDTTTVSVLIDGDAPANIEYMGDPQSFGAVCDLGRPLPESSQIQVSVTFSDLANPANTTNASWAFTTGDASDVDPPAFLRNFPGNGEGGVDPAFPVRVEIGDNVAVDEARVQMFVNGTETELEIENIASGRVRVVRTDTTPLPPGRVTVHVVVYDLAENRSELVYEFDVEASEVEVVRAVDMGAIVPDGYWADDPDRPLEIRNLPGGWAVRIFNTAGVQVRVFKNDSEDEITWTWDFTNDRGKSVARALYLVRVVDNSGHVQQSGKFLVQATP